MMMMEMQESNACGGSCFAQCKYSLLSPKFLLLFGHKPTPAAVAADAVVRAGAAAATEQLEARGQRFALGEGKYKAAIRLVRDYALLHRGEAQELLARAQMKAKVAGLRRLVERDSPVGAITVLDDEADGEVRRALAAELFDLLLALEPPAYHLASEVRARFGLEGQRSPVDEALVRATWRRRRREEAEKLQLPHGCTVLWVARLREMRLAAAHMDEALSAAAGGGAPLLAGIDAEWRPVRQRNVQAAPPRPAPPPRARPARRQPRVSGRGWGSAGAGRGLSAFSRGAGAQCRRGGGERARRARAPTSRMTPAAAALDKTESHSRAGPARRRRSATAGAGAGAREGSARAAC